MTSHFKRKTDEEIQVVLAALDRCSFFDERDQCRTVEVGCCWCDKMFAEELEAAKVKVRERSQFLCLACDPGSRGAALWGLTVRLRWGTG